MYYQLIKKILFVFGLLTVQVALVPNLVWPLSKLNVILVVLIFITIIINYKVAFLYSLVFSLFLEQFSVYPFGLILVAFLIVLFIIGRIFKRLFTDRSFYSFLFLVLMGTAFFNLILVLYFIFRYFILSKQVSVLEIINKYFFIDLGWEVLVNLILAMLIFMGFHLFSRKLKSVFIEV